MIKNKNSYEFINSSGGLATGMNSIHSKNDTLWIGWPGIASDNLNIKTFNWRKDFNIDDALDVPHPHPGLKSHSLFADNIKGWFFK